MVTAAAVGTTAAAAAAAAAGAGLSGSAPAGLASAAAAASLPQLLQSVGLFVLCCAGALFLLASIPCLFAMARAAHRAEAVLRIIEAELPDTIATAKLPGMELTDTLAAMGAGSSSGGDGPGSGGSAAAAVAALATPTPAKPPKPGAKLRAFLAQRAHSDPELLLKARAAMRGATTNVRRARFGLGVLGFVNYIRFMLDAQQLAALRASLAASDGGMAALEAEQQHVRVQA